MIRLFLLCLALALPAQAREIVWGDYTLTHRSETKVAHAKYGEWPGFIGLNRDAPAEKIRRHELRFELEADGYFTPDNGGHFAVAVAADYGPRHLIGRGIVIGNVGAYGVRTGGCVQSQGPNRITIESFWAGGNCVWGDATSSVRMMDGERYRITVSAERTTAGEDGRIVSYRLEQRVGRRWREISDATIYDPSEMPLRAGWYVLEVFSEHSWTVRLYNVTETVE